MRRVAIVGAGPAGLAAAHAALRAGAEVTLLDAGTGLGGQFWRHLPPSRPAAREGRLHHGWNVFERLRAAVLGHPSCRVVLRAQVWAIDRDAGRVRLRIAVGDADGAGRTTESLVPDALVLATGAHDLTLPFPGWDLPGVFTAGAAQALAKSERVAIGERVVVAGAGPFLLPVAASLTATGARVLAVHEASRVGTLAAGWSRGTTAVLRMPAKVGELAGYVGGQVHGRIPYRPGTAVVAAHGTDRVDSVTVARLDANWSPVPGTERRVACDAVAVSHGFTPRLELALAAGCAVTAGGPFDRFVVVDGDQRTSTEQVYAAGEITGIGGSDAALAEGALAGWVAAGGGPGAPIPVAARRRIRGHRRFEQALSAAHGIRPGWSGWLDDSTLVCRCEEVDYGRLRSTASATASRGLRSLRLTTRAGLGPCQARVCGRTVEALVSDNGRAPLLDDASSDRRPLAAPLRFRELAALPDERTTP
jgi:D-hydroxyproline dehydrogenase subunit alpha